MKKGDRSPNPGARILHKRFNRGDSELDPERIAQFRREIRLQVLVALGGCQWCGRAKPDDRVEDYACIWCRVNLNGKTR
jgi:hypothetical protein